MSAVRTCAIVCVTTLTLAVGPAPPTADAWDWEAHGSLDPSDPTFGRPSTSFPPCSLSSNGTNVYYDVYTDYYPGGYAYVEMTGTVDLPVIVAYPGGTFNPASPCDNIIGINGCFPLPIAGVSPVFEAPGTFDIVITSCYNDDVGTYDVYITAYLLLDGFESGDLSAWSSSTGGT